jgi:hypothetical protein
VRIRNAFGGGDRFACWSPRLVQSSLKRLHVHQASRWREPISSVSGNVAVNTKRELSSIGTVIIVCVVVIVTEVAAVAVVLLSYVAVV